MDGRIDLFMDGLLDIIDGGMHKAKVKVLGQKFGHGLHPCRHMYKTMLRKVLDGITVAPVSLSRMVGGGYSKQYDYDI